MKTISRCLALVIAILFSGLPAMAQAQRKPDATRILNNVFRMYSRLTSYQDEGILITTTDEPTGGTIEKMPFETFFKRPNLFRFDWTEYGLTKLGRTYRVWFNGTDAFTYWEPDRYEKDESLDMAIAGATGVSSGTVRTVADLLLPDELGSSILNRFEKISLLGEEVFEGVRCHRIKAKVDDDSIELWVGKNDLLLRKFRRENKRDDTVTIAEEIRRKIQVDQSIPAVIFNYEPPIALTPRKDIDIDSLLNPGPPAWSEFRSEEGQFTVLMPDKPTSQASKFETPQGHFEQHAFVATHGTFVCLIAYTDFPKQTKAENNVDGIVDGVRDEFIKAVGGKVTSESPLSIDGHPGRDIKADVFRGELRLRLLLVGDRMYMLSITKVGGPFAPDEEAPNKFFTSFKLTSTTNRIALKRAKSRLTQIVYCL